jgi:hypothetical protein
MGCLLSKEDEKLRTAAKIGDVAAARAALDSGADKEHKDKEVRSCTSAAGRRNACGTAVRALTIFASPAERFSAAGVGCGERPLGRAAAPVGARRRHPD